MARSLNRVQLIGNLTRDPELRYTPSGTGVCSFSIATNRNWTTDTGEKKEEVEFHRIVAWNKLAELCSQFLVKGRKVYVEGRLATRSWTAQDGSAKSTTEIVIDDMILLDSQRRGTEDSTRANAPEAEQESREKDPSASSGQGVASSKESKESKEPKEKVKKEAEGAEDITADDIPF